MRGSRRFRRRRPLTPLRAAAAGVAIALAGCGAPPRGEAIAADVTVRVAAVSDGDSFRAVVHGTRERVRLIGIDAPELRACGGADARRALLELIDGRRVRLSFDEEPRDRYGRLLAYVFVRGTFVNGEMVSTGNATPLRIEPNIARAGDLERRGRLARAERRGLHRACG